MIEDKSLLKIDELYEKYNLECSRKAIFNEISKDKDKNVTEKRINSLSNRESPLLFAYNAKSIANPR